MKFLPWAMAAMWLIARVIASQFLSIENAKNFGVLSNVLLILILIFLSIYYKYKTVTAERPGFFEDLKDCMKSALKYVMAVIAALALFYGVISNDVQVIRQARISAFEQDISTDEGLDKLKREHPEIKDKSREELLLTNKESVERYVSVQAQILGGLVALTFVSLAYSLLAVFFWRTVVKRI